MAFTPEQEAFLISFAKRELEIAAINLANEQNKSAEEIKATQRAQFIDDLTLAKQEEIMTAVEQYDNEHK